MEIEEMLAHVDYLMHIAGSKCDSWVDAQDLVQETILDGLHAIRKGKDINNARNWLCTVLNRKYYDLLREKYRKPLEFYGMDFDVAMEEENNQASDADEDGLTEEENLRRSVARLTKLYREIIVRHYFHGQEVKKIADELSLPENTVKSRLRLGRDKLRKDLTMEKYEKQSFEPEDLWISSTGYIGLDDQPHSLVNNDKIAMNLLILAYEKPVTIPELSDAIGISTAYIEPVVERLVAGELMKKVGDKVFTDFIIYNQKDSTNTLELQKKLAGDLCGEIWKHVEEGLRELRLSAYYKKQNSSQAMKLEGYFVLHSVYRAVIRVRDEVAGNGSKYDYPDRSDGGRWYAMGTRYPANYDYDKSPQSEYGISGEAGGNYENLLGARMIGLYDYDTKALGKTHSAYHCVGNWRDARESVMKFLYAVYCDNEAFLSGISQKLLTNIDTFIELDFVERLAEGKLILNVPVLSMGEKGQFYELTGAYTDKLCTVFHDQFITMIKNPVVVPKQIQADVPDFLRYINTCCYFPSALIYEARERGLFLKGYEKPVPPVILFVDVAE